jgi:hypothetical protein
MNSGGTEGDIQGKVFGEDVLYFVVNETPSGFLLSPY